MPAAQFHRCNSGRDCSSDAQCVPSLNGGNACICGPGLMGDGATCSPQPAFASGGEVPDAIKNGDCTPTRVDSDGARGQINRGPAVYCLQARRGVTYTITVTLGDLDDSVLELWSADALIDSNDVRAPRALGSVRASSSHTPAARAGLRR